MTETAFWGLMWLQLKHFIADYPLQTRWMLRKGMADWSFFWPLAAHSAVHGAMTTSLCVWIEPSYWWLGAPL